MGGHKGAQKGYFMQGYSQALRVQQWLCGWGYKVLCVQKLPTPLNTQKRFVPELIQVSPNVSEGRTVVRACGSLKR